MNDWVLFAVETWDARRAVAERVGWPPHPALTVHTCAQRHGISWVRSRRADMVADFLQLSGRELVEKPHFGKTKILRLIEIVGNCLNLSADTDANSDASADYQISDEISLRERLVELGIPDNFPLKVVALPTRIANYCDQNEINLLGELLDVWESMGERYFLDLPNMGRTSVEEISEFGDKLRDGDMVALGKWLPVSLSGSGLSLATGMNGIIATMMPQQRKMMENRLVQGLTLEDSASEFFVTRERVRQIEARILDRTANLLAIFPMEQERLLNAWLQHEPLILQDSDGLGVAGHELACAMVAGCFRELPEGTTRNMETESRIEHWRDMLRQHPDLLVEGVDLQAFMEEEVADEFQEMLCMSLLDGKGRIKLDQVTGRVVHTGPRLREVVKAIMATEDDPIPLTWLHQLVSLTPTHAHVSRELIFKYKAQWKCDDSEFPHHKILWNQ